LSTFSDQFHHYLPPNPNAVKLAMVSGLVVLDADILLNAYRFAPPAREELTSILSDVADRTWIPHQVAEEFHKNRLKVIADCDTAYLPNLRHLDAAQEQLYEEAVSKIAELANHAELSKDAKSGLTDLIEISTDPARSAMENLREGHRLNLYDSDVILAKYGTLYDDKVGQPFTAEEMDKAQKEAQRRIDNRIPPGCRDSNKDSPFGDYFIWKQTLTEAKKRANPWLVFVTADIKEDWYYIVKGERICARPELAKEARDEADVNLIMMNQSSFLFHAHEYLGANVSAETIRQSEEFSATERSANRRIVMAQKELYRQENLRTAINDAFEDLNSRARERDTLTALLDNPKIDAYQQRIIQRRIDFLTHEEESTTSKISDRMKDLEVIDLRFADEQ
jgi:hypothetical protein